MTLEVLRHFASGEELAKQAAKDLADKILKLLTGQTVHIVLTGGSVGTKTLSELAPLLKDKNLSQLHLWWGDERFVDEDSADRNYVQAHEALISKISIPAENVHQIPASNVGELSVGASIFADEVASVAPKFDVVLLGVGPDGHVASLFPDSTAEGFGEFVVAEISSPKPPAERISMSYFALSSASEVWFLVAGSDKSAAVAEVFENGKLPAALVSGTELTKWYLDDAAAKAITF